MPFFPTGNIKKILISQQNISFGIYSTSPQILDNSKYAYKYALNCYVFSGPNEGKISVSINRTKYNRNSVLFKALEWFSSTFHGIINFQGLFEKILHC